MPSNPIATPVAVVRDLYLPSWSLIDLKGNILCDVHDEATAWNIALTLNNHGPLLEALEGLLNALQSQTTNEAPSTYSVRVNLKRDNSNALLDRIDAEKAKGK